MRSNKRLGQRFILQKHDYPKHSARDQSIVIVEYDYLRFRHLQSKLSDMLSKQLWAKFQVSRCWQGETKIKGLGSCKYIAKDGATNDWLGMSEYKHNISFIKTWNPIIRFESSGMFHNNLVAKIQICFPSISNWSSCFTLNISWSRSWTKQKLSLLSDKLSNLNVILCLLQWQDR